MEWYTDKKFISLVAIFILLLSGIVIYSQFSGLFLILALLVFGTLALFWKERYIKLGGLALLVLLALCNIYINGMKFGIDFSGGTRIPVILEKPVDADTMDELVQTIKKRVSILGLTEAKVRAIGESEINVEVPSSDPAVMDYIEDALAHQGVYMGIVDGKVAVKGEHIFRASIRAVSGGQLAQTGADWGVEFSIDQEGARNFADTVKGKADYPVYMYLDRPSNAVLFLTVSQLDSAILEDSGKRESVKAMEEGLALEGDDIEVYLVEEMENVTPKTNSTIALVSENMDDEYLDEIENAGFVLKEYPEEEIIPEFIRTRSGVLVLQKLEAVGLMSAPLLSASITTGIPNYNYIITGSVSETDPTLRAKAAIDEVKKVESILKGGSLPVKITLGSRTTLPPSLGEEFLKLSIIGIGAALVAISLLIGLRYRNLRATLPVVAISMAELAILLSIIGSFTIDLAAMAGIIAAIGVGVDAQIVITDELLKRDERHKEEKLDSAFSIIKTNVIVATLSMVPLLFSGLVEVIGFAISTVLGSLLGYLLSRPAYAAIVEMVIGKE